MSKDNLGDRIKSYYEDAYRIFLPRRMPMMIRVDGAHFSSLTANINKPFDDNFIKSMLDTALYLCQEIQGVKLAYWQSDEISLVLTDYDTLQTQAWFDRNLQKMCSTSAAMATLAFNKSIVKYFPDKAGTFDSRCKVLPKEEVCNALLWRQQDATRNSVQMLARSHFSHKSLHQLKNSQIQDKLMLEKGINWNDMPTIYKRGAAIKKNDNGVWAIDYEMPILTQDRNYVNDLLEPVEV